MGEKIILIGDIYLRNIDLSSGLILNYSILEKKDDVSKDESISDDKWKLLKSSGDLRDTNKFFNKLFNINISGKNIHEFTSYYEISLWQFAISYIWPSFFKAIELIKILEKIINEHNPNKFIVYLSIGESDNYIWQGVFKAISHYHKIPVIYKRQPIYSFIKTFLSEPKRILKNLLGYGFMSPKSLKTRYYSKMTWLFYKLRGRNDKQKSNGKKLLFAGVAQDWTSTPGNPQDDYDAQLYPLLENLYKSNWNNIIAIDCPYGFPSQILRKVKASLMGKLSSNGVTWRGFYSLEYKTVNVKEIIKGKRYYRFKYKELLKNPDFIKDFTFNNIQLIYALKDVLKYTFLNIFPECIKLLSIAENILKTEKPEAVMTTYESGPYQRAIIAQAGKMKIPTMALMHGMISDNHYDYMHEGVVQSSRNSQLGFIIPDITCVWGNIWKKNLVEKGYYLNESVVVTGNWKYDNILDKFRNGNKNDYKKCFDIIPDNKVILLLPSGTKVVEFSRHCLEIIIQYRNVVPIIKIHPMDWREPVGEILKEFGYSEKYLIKDSLFEAINIAEVVICQPSTVIGEAIFFNKPVIFYNMLNNRGYELYADSGACLYATNKEKLKLDIDLCILNSERVRDKLQEARNKFIEECYFKNDSKSAERVVKELNKIHKYDTFNA